MINLFGGIYRHPPMVYLALSPNPSMQAALPGGSLAGVFPSPWPQGRNSPASFAARCGSLGNRQRTIPLVCFASNIDPCPGYEPIDVIGIGSRKDSVIDFCLASPWTSNSGFRFWTICSRDPTKVQLIERRHDAVINNVKFPQHSCRPATILVASAGHGLEHIAAIDILQNVKSGGGLAIAIVLKPFNFEGQRRQTEVKDLVDKLKSCTNFYVAVEANSLFKLEVQTLAEALESANNSVLMAVKTISSVISKTCFKVFNTPEGTPKEVKPSEVVKLLESFREGRIYCGSGNNMKAAITQATFLSPFLDHGLKNFRGSVIAILASSCAIGDSDLPQIILSLHQISGYTGDIIISVICEPHLEPTLVVVMLLIMGSNGKIVTQNKGFFSCLLDNLPFLISFLHGNSEANDNLTDDSTSESSENAYILLDTMSSSGLDLVNDACPTEALEEQVALCNDFENVPSSKESGHKTTGREAESMKTNHELFSQYHGLHSEDPGILVAKHSSDLGPGFHVAQLWAKECSSLTRTNNIDEVDVFALPVGVKSSNLTQTQHSTHILPENSDGLNLENTGEKAAEDCKKHSFLSVRAATMLEAERESKKAWNPVMAMQYRGGIYRGHCQGGLPEGKGRLTFVDGSFYDGLWKSGKRSGLGTFCYSNGDLFQGAWRDDLMHGKGWFYFHTGDRWFANFWKGKANGEGRFFSKNGSVFFGFFRDGWRDGHTVCIDVDGSRWTELWDEGVLISRAPLVDKEA